MEYPLIKFANDPKLGDWLLKSREASCLEGPKQIEETDWEQQGQMQSLAVMQGQTD